MRIGFIGAGKVGCSLGRFFADHGLEVTGYYDTVSGYAEEAAEFAGHSKAYEDISELVYDSDALFLTVPDGLITQVWDQIRDFPLEGKYLCHCSGALSSREAFPGIEDRGAFGYSIHPLFAVSDKLHSYKELSHAYFTIEGDQSHLELIADLFRSFGNPVCFIEAGDKVKYHCAAAICSNLVVGLVQNGLDLMKECGFDEDSAAKALAPILLGNMQHIVDRGTTASLTGPVERADVKTVEKHLHCLNQEQRTLYRLLSRTLVEIGKRKNPARDYSDVSRLLEGDA